MKRIFSRNKLAVGIAEAPDLHDFTVLSFQTGFIDGRTGALAGGVALTGDDDDVIACHGRGTALETLIGTVGLDRPAIAEPAAVAGDRRGHLRFVASRG